MAASKLNLIIDQGATFTQLIYWRAGRHPPVLVDLTGCTARMHVRAFLESPDILLELTTVNGRLTLGGAAGTIFMEIPATDTAAITWATGVYDLEIEFPDGVVRRVLKGSVVVTPEVTRD